jgi:hypothetical protein
MAASTLYPVKLANPTTTATASQLGRADALRGDRAAMLILPASAACSDTASALSR